MPLSTQWGPQGYFYAIQIAQYGLSHYSKNLTERPPHVEVYDTADDRDSRPGAWAVPKGCSLARVHDKTRHTAVRQFSAPGTASSSPAAVASSPLSPSPFPSPTPNRQLLTAFRGAACSDSGRCLFVRG